MDEVGDAFEHSDGAAGSPPEATGERLIPEAYAGQLVQAEHLARYHLAARLAPGRHVLDAACGEGYGLAILQAAGAASVVGIDVDPAVVAHARDRYKLDVVEADVAKLPFPDGEFDLVTSFETIEHVADPEQALDELARMLAPDGMLIVSTPNAAEYLEDNPFHLREFHPEEFLALLRSRFTQVHPLYQQNFLTSAVLDAGRLAEDSPDVLLDLETRKVAGAKPGRELYTLALCGPAEMPPLDANVAVLADVYEAHDLAHQLRECTRLLREWEARAIEAERVQREWDARATEAERVQREWEARATEAERQNAEHLEAIDVLTGSLSWRVTKPLRAVRSRLR
jgi:2-polyprenyl-3-methyl-5-hydroxy-6-metoxy-1,4-benzoquinol methylase